MISQYDKAIAGLLAALVTLLAAFGIKPDWLSPELLTAATPIITGLVVYLVPNKPT